MTKYNLSSVLDNFVGTYVIELHNLIHVVVILECFHFHFKENSKNQFIIENGQIRSYLLHGIEEKLNIGL